MKIKIFTLLLFSILYNSHAQYTRILDIPGRAQWNSDDGYCGEESLQMIGLYYGNYISEKVTRTLAGGWFLIGDNDQAVLDALSFTYNEWDFNQSTPQYQNYLVWLKQNLYNYHPVIITVFMQGMSDPDYDHIIPAIGFSGADTTTFNNSDELMFNDCFASSYFTRTFQTIWDTRNMTGNGTNYVYCIPRDVDFGCAITGIKDSLHETRPVHISLDRWDEPDPSQGQTPVIMNATITTDSLTPGVKYALLRYDDHSTVPASGFDPSNASGAVYFTASSTSETFTDSFMSDTAVFYRCIPYNYNGIHELTSNKNFGLHIYPNPASDMIILNLNNVNNENTELFIHTVTGVLVRSEILKQNNEQINIADLDSGIYFLYVKSKELFEKQKIIIQR